MQPAIAVLLTRYSTGIKHLQEPGPDTCALQTMVQAALRAPDHGELVPFRFAAVSGMARIALADLFETHGRSKGKDDISLAIERERALRAPVTVAVLARIDLGHPTVPVHEQWMCVGGAVSNFLTAAHALGFAGKMLSGDKVHSLAIASAFAGPGETLVGWMALGTPARTPGSGREKSAAQALSTWP